MPVAVHHRPVKKGQFARLRPSQRKLLKLVSPVTGDTSSRFGCRSDIISHSGIFRTFSIRPLSLFCTSLSRNMCSICLNFLNIQISRLSWFLWSANKPLSFYPRTHHDIFGDLATSSRCSHNFMGVMQRASLHPLLFSLSCMVVIAAAMSDVEYDSDDSIQEVIALSLITSTLDATLTYDPKVASIIEDTRHRFRYRRMKKRAKRANLMTSDINSPKPSNACFSSVKEPSANKCLQSPQCNFPMKQSCIKPINTIPTTQHRHYSHCTVTKKPSNSSAFNGNNMVEENHNPIILQQQISCLNEIISQQQKMLQDAIIIMSNDRPTLPRSMFTLVSEKQPTTDKNKQRRKRKDLYEVISI